MKNENWVKEQTLRNLKRSAKSVLSMIKKSRKGKVFKLIKIRDKPLTYKEIEVPNKSKIKNHEKSGKNRQADQR